MSALKAQVLGFESKAKSIKVPFVAQTNKHTSVQKKILNYFQKSTYRTADQSKFQSRGLIDCRNIEGHTM